MIQIFIIQKYINIHQILLFELYIIFIRNNIKIWKKL